MLKYDTLFQETGIIQTGFDFPVPEYSFIIVRKTVMED